MDNNPRKRRSEKGRKVFDPRDASTGSDGAELLDPSVTQRGEQWWMYLAGQPRGLRSHRHLQRVTSYGSPALRRWLEPHSGGDGRTCAKSPGGPSAGHGTVTADGTAHRT